MRSLSSAAALIAASDNDTTLTLLLTELGFSAPARALNTAARERMTLPPDITSAHVARGIGALRALIITIAPNAQPRETILKVATRLATRIPHLLWLVVARQENSPLFAIATWSTHSFPPKVAALLTNRSTILDSDAETLCALAAARALPNDSLQHARWLETLGREAVTRRFYRALEKANDTLANALTPSPPEDAARTIALLYISRILFLAFLETKGWLNNDFGFLINGFANCMASGGSYHKKVLEPLFFGTLNTRPSNRATRAHAFGKIPFLNGGLFSRTPLERQYRTATLPDDALGELYGDVLARYRLTAREDSSSWSEPAVDPEMLGKVFESLMASQERKRSGAFYTPQSLVEHVTRLTLTEALHTPIIPKSAVEDAFAGTLKNASLRGRILERISTLSILDPACGSGAFLVHALERLATLRAQLGDIRPIAAIRRSILITSIYGVDINPIAVWLCELRLWLSVVIENHERDPMRVLPLPNLDHQIRVGDSLSGSTFTPTIQTAPKLTALRHRYARASGPKKKTLVRLLERAERARAIFFLDRTITTLSSERKELLNLSRSKDLFNKRLTSRSTKKQLDTLRTSIQQLRTQRRAIINGAALPFSFPTHFPTAADANGFDVILGNPPWVRPHHIPLATRTTLRSTFSTLRNAAWRSGANYAKAGPGFATQVDLAALFLERATNLLAPQGAIGFLLPAKLWRSLAGGGTRNLITSKLHLTHIEDLSNSPPTFDAATYPSLIVARRPIPNATNQQMQPPLTPNTTITIHLPTSSSTSWTAPLHSIAFDSSPGAPWLLIPPHVRHAFNALTQAGSPLAHSPLGRPLLGVKSGCNDAFIVQIVDQSSRDTIPADTETANDVVTVTSGTHTGLIERTLLRPLLRGANVRPWHTPRSDSYIIWPHSSDGTALRSLPKHARKWLTRWQHQLERRTDARAYATWWSLFRTESANASLPRVVWSDFGTSPRATILNAHDPTVPLNTCYVIPCPTQNDALALATLLNSPVIAAFLDVIAEPAQGGYHRYLGWTMALIPIPHDWPRARTILAPLAQRALNNDSPSQEELTTVTLEAYRLTRSALTPLMSWTNR